MEEAFKKFSSKGTEITSAEVTKWCKDAGVFGKNMTSNHLDIAFSKVKTKGARNLTVGEMEALIGELAVKYKDDKKLDINAATAELKEKLISAGPQSHGATATANAAQVAHMTDTSKYTGTHKERFDESGKGKGIEGREDVAKNDGYVQGYKDKGTK